MVSFKEFQNFCEARAMDGYWNINTAVTCIAIYEECRNYSILPFRREKYFRTHYGEVITKFVEEASKEIMKRVHI